MADNNATSAPIIIIKRKKKGGHDAHHGGAWKVAYADFVTAMMAFFLLLWLLNATTEEQRRGISDYFSPASVARTASGAGGVMGGLTMLRDGVQRSQGSTIAIPMPTVPSDKSDTEPLDGENPGDGGEVESEGTERQKPKELTAGEKDELLAQREEQRFEEAAAELRHAIQSAPELAKLAESLIIDRTPEGLRIQIVDQDKYSMFPLGSAAMYDYTHKLLAEVAKIIGKLPNRIAVTGHTDSTPYSRSSSYTNWELSTDRALASRRALVEAGLPDSRIERVIGKADKEHLLPNEPNSPRNRRLSIVLLRENPITPIGTRTGAVPQPSRAAATTR